MKVVSVRKDTIQCQNNDPIVLTFEVDERANVVQKMFRDKFMQEHKKEFANDELHLTCDQKDCFEVCGDGDNFITLFKVAVDDCQTSDGKTNERIFEEVASVIGYMTNGEYHI